MSYMEDLRKFVRGFAASSAASTTSSATSLMTGMTQRPQCVIDEDTLCAGAELHEFFSNKLSAISQERQRLEGIAKAADADYLAAEAYCKRVATEQKVLFKEVDQVAVISTTVSYLKDRITSLLEAMDAVETALDAEEAIAAQAAATAEIEKQKASVHTFVQQKEREMVRLEDTLKANVARVKAKAEEDYAKRQEAERRKAEESLNRDLEKWKREHMEKKDQKVDVMEGENPQESEVKVEPVNTEGVAKENVVKVEEKKKDLASVVLPADDEDELEKFLSSAPAEGEKHGADEVEGEEKEGEEKENDGEAKEEKKEEVVEGEEEEEEEEESDGKGRPVILQEVEPDQQP